jgi:hypothetical protein
MPEKGEQRVAMPRAVDNNRASINDPHGGYRAVGDTDAAIPD